MEILRPMNSSRLIEDSGGVCDCDSSDNSANYSNQCNSRRKNSGSRSFSTFEFSAAILLLFIGFSSAYSSKDLSVEAKVQKEAEIGGYVEMTCKWKIYGSKKLYSVKWYKDGHEFFRYMPDNHPILQTFQQPGVKLDKTSSDGGMIRLLDVALDSAGQYKCEVSTDAPAFATAFRTGNLTIISLPQRGPEITGLLPQYAVGENITANCSAWPSIPKAELQWTINGKPVSPEHTVVYPQLSSATSAGVRNILGLRLEAETRHFVGGGGSVRVKCLARVGSRTYDAEKYVQMAHVNNQRLSASDLRVNGRGRASQFEIDCILVLTMVIVALT